MNMRPLQVVVSVEGSIETGCAVMSSEGAVFGEVWSLKRYEDEVAIARATDGDVVIVAFQGNNYFDPTQFMLPTVLETYHDTMTNRYLWRSKIPTEWSRLMKTDVFVPKLAAFVESCCKARNISILRDSGYDGYDIFE